MSQVDLLKPLLKHLTPLLKKQGFKRDPDVAPFAIYSRKTDGDAERIGFIIERTKNKKGEFEFGVALGIEFGDFERTKGWIGMPHTHQSVPLETLNKKAKKKLICSGETDWKEFANQVSGWTSEALEELDDRKEKLKKSYISAVEHQGKNRKQRLGIFAERKQKELRKRKPKGEKQTPPPITETMNILEIAGKLLRSKTDQLEELALHQFEDDFEAHDDSLHERLEEEFVNNANLLRAELETALWEADETGSTEHDKIPVNGVLYYAWWQVGWKILYLAASHEDRELPYVLLLGTTKIEQ